MAPLTNFYALSLSDIACMHFRATHTKRTFMQHTTKCNIHHMTEGPPPLDVIVSFSLPVILCCPKSPMGRCLPQHTATPTWRAARNTPSSIAE